ncbi:SH3 domain and tetratricopeptide repeat-containing protein 1 isoform X3 [Stegostoma tigrinum]|uniref:SH3 domain and tetratricopeptide repeat-containing protein 1 isoform X3 n=1 Tax=Stegostoma tigrinum TaxID=3053191 RepID=UPI00202AD97A|nr:SH3 domain and tetratricopeptide repeat-containing protein 1 isoform X3 [Stegostoma tigrinum]
MESTERGDSLPGEDFLLYTIEEERSSRISEGTARDFCLKSDRELGEPGSDPDSKLVDKPATVAQSGMVHDSNVEGPLEESKTTVSLPEKPSHDSSAMGNWETDISLKLIMKRQTTGLPDIQLQDWLRAKLRILENDCGEVIALLSELSARLLSIHSDQDLIVITFKTFEEIWKFSTYYSLGLISHCMENALLDQGFWLNCLNEEDVRIEVQISDESLKVMCKGLLLQEGTFFLKYPFSLQKSEENDQQPRGNNLVVVDKAKSGSELSGKSLINGKKISVPKSHMELLVPFHQWFFKRHSEDIGTLNNVAAEFPHPLGQGSCVAEVEYEGVGPEELSFQIGDRIEIIGFLSTCLQWFLGRNEANGRIGFVKINHMKPEDFMPLANDLLFIDEEEKHYFMEQDKFIEEDSLKMLKQMTQTDISVVYRLDTLNSQHEEKEEQQTPSNQEPELLKIKLNNAVNRLEEKPIPSVNEEQSNEQVSISCDQEDGLDSEEPWLCVGHTGNLDNPEMFHHFLVMLDNEEYNKHFKHLYDSSFSFLMSIFCGFSEEEVVHYLEVAREAARKRQMEWAQTRICFLLGRMCANKLKYSQARVYFEEALSVMKGQFTDLFLLIALYTNLVVIYLKQKNQEKCSAIFEKIASLLLGIPNYICTTEMEAEVLKYVLGKAVLSENKHAEARACFLLAKLHINLKQYEDALPFIERLQFLRNMLMLESRTSLDFHFTLGSLYYRKCLPNLAISCAKLSCIRPTRTLMDCLRGASFIMKGTSKLCGMGRLSSTIPTQVVPYLKWALSLANLLKRDHISQALCHSLSEIYKLHGMYGEAIHYMKMAINTDVFASTEEMVPLLISFAWLHILNSQAAKAVVFLNTILELPSVQSCRTQQGIVYNMVGISMRRMRNVKEATKNYHQALSISVDLGLKFNQAITNANFGLLCLWSKAYRISEQFLLKSIHIFSELTNVASEENFFQVLITLGQYYIEEELKENGIFCYEWALLIALKANLIERQVRATRLLCQFYNSVLPNEAQCIIYNEFLLHLARKLANKELEGHVLQNTSQLYLNLGTERAFRSALEYTKRSLGIFIDLEKKEKEAYAWLQAGKIYYMLGENELVDMYIQVAQDAAVSTENLDFALEIFEAAGNVFFDGPGDREKAISFFRDRALPLAVKVENAKVELRLCNKLTELLLHVKTYSEALDYAQTALALSVTLGDTLNERVAYHRLALVHKSLGQCELAEHFYLKALSLYPCPLEFDEETIYFVRIYIQLGEMAFCDLKDPYDAAGYYHLALAAAMDLGSKKSQLKICTRLATIYHNFLVDREMSLYFYQKARKFANELNIRRLDVSPAQCYKTKAQAPSKSLF